MKRAGTGARSGVWIFLFLGVVLPAAVSAAVPAGLLGPGWIRSTPPPITPDEARARLLAAPAPMEVTASPTEATPEIVALARALENDPRRIFDYVHNRIEHLPTYGCVLGATATYYAGRGNDCDQASLFIALMRQAGFQARYVLGDVLYAPATLGNWLGAESSVAQNVLLNGGVPIAGGTGGWWVSRVWAEAYVEGSWRTFDPAMKTHETIAAGVTNLPAAMGFTATSFLARAQSGAVVGAHSVKGLHEANIRADLALFSTNLAAHLATHHPEAGFEEVLGGRRIVETELGAYASSPPNALSVANVQTHETLPDTMHHTIEVTHAEAPANTRIFKTSEVAGRRMTLFHDGTNMALSVDGTRIFAFAGTPTNTFFNVLVAIDHPTVSGQGHYFPLRSGPSYAIVNDFDGVSPALLAARNDRLSRARQQGYAATAEPVRGEALWILGQEWCRQVGLFERLVDRLNGTRSIAHHRVGVTGQEEGFYIDMPLLYGSNVSTDGGSDAWLSGRVQSMMSSAFEHGVLRQFQDHSAYDSVSTVRLLHHANGAGIATYVADGANWTNGANVRAALTNYTVEALANLDALIAAGYDVVLPQDGRQRIQDWEGVGYIQHYQQGNGFSMGMIIGGGYAGGYTARRTALDPARPEWENGARSPVNPRAPISRDPVDLYTGAFLYEHEDLRVGPGEAPMGLRFGRAYSSAGNRSAGPMGPGWSHSYQASAVTHSGGAAGLGTGGAVQSVPAIAFARVALDVLDAHLDPLGWSATAIGAKWAMDQLIGNAVTVHAGGQTSTFLLAPDGRYLPPPGRGDLLAPHAGGYLLRDRAGAQSVFDAQGRIASRQDANGNAEGYAYDGDGRLTGVTDAFGKTLAFGYDSNGRLVSAGYGGRGVQYTYAGGNLVGYRDAAGRDWGYGYDAENRMTQVRKADPATAVTVSNAYDALGRVETQVDALGNLYTFRFSGYRNIESFPDGSRVVYVFDPDRRFAAREDQAGKRVRFEYNGLGQTVRFTDRLGGETHYDYHRETGWPVRMTDAGGRQTVWSYEARAGAPDLFDLARVEHPDGSFETYARDARGNVLVHTDRAGSAWTYTYSARGQLLTAATPAGGTATRTLHSDGCLATRADSDTGSTSFGYDAFKRLTLVTHPGGATLRLAYDPNDRLTSMIDENNRETTFSYDANGNLAAVVDPDGRRTGYAYDAMDRPLWTTNRVGQTTQRVYDIMGRLERVIDATGVRAIFGYDVRDWPATVTRAGRTWTAVHDDEGVPSDRVTPLNHRTSERTDALGLVVAVTNPLGHVTSLGRDAMSRVTAVTNPLGRVTRYDYDAAGRLRGVALPSGGAVAYDYAALGTIRRVADLNGREWTFQHTGMGRLQSVSDPLGRTASYSYDARGRLAGIAFPGGGALAISRDAVGNVTREQYAGGPDLVFAYDANNRLTNANDIAFARDAEGRITRTESGGIYFGAGHDAAGRLATATYSNGAFSVTYTYGVGENGHGLLTRVSDSLTGTQIDFAYDDARRLRTMSLPNGELVTCTRDGADRMTRLESGAHVDVAPAYDAAGRVTHIDLAAPLAPSGHLATAISTLSFDAAAQVASAGYAYDARGRLTAAPGRTFAWDGASRLTGWDSVGLACNGLGQVRARTVSGTTTRFHYNHAIGLAPLVAEQDAATGRMLRYYVWTPAGRLLYMIDAADGNKVYFYHFDQVGSTLALTDSAGQVAAAYAYDPYGRLLARTGTSPQPFLFCGAWGVRAEMGPAGPVLYQMRARYYDPETQRFISPEPIWPQLDQPLYLNPYQYAATDPVAMSDPTGYEPEHTDANVRIAARIGFSERFACPYHMQLLQMRIQQRENLRRSLRKFGEYWGWSESRINAEIERELNSGSFDLSNWQKAMEIGPDDPLNLHAVLINENGPGSFEGPVTWFVNHNGQRIELGQGENLQLTPEQARALFDRPESGGVVTVHFETTYRDAEGSDTWGGRVDISFDPYRYTNP